MNWTDLNDAAIWVPMAASLLTGAAIGFEREVKAKAAGLRTHTLVCFSSAILMMAGTLQAEWLFVPVPGANVVADPTRMAHGILTGIGFLCAGVIFRQGVSVHGLTTAASLWMTAALGLLYGAGLFWLAFAGTVAAVVVLVALRIVNLAIPDRTEILVEAVCLRPADDTVGRFVEVLDRHCVKRSPVALKYEAEGSESRLRLGATIWLRGTTESAALASEINGIGDVVETSIAPAPAADRLAWNSLSD